MNIRACRPGVSALALSTALAASLAAGSGAFAQDRTPRAQTTDSPGQVVPTIPDPNATSAGEVVVTARKTSETLRDVPSTITAVTAGQLAAQGPVTGTGDLLRVAPGVRFNDLQAPNLSEVSIRGSGTQRATGADSGVGLFFNGAYVGSSTLGGRNFKNVDFFDLERVEVLKGPQGALYGRNSEYGTVNIIPAKPSFTSSGYIDETYISGLDQNRLTAVVNAPINDEVAVRLGAESYLQSGGFYRNSDTGSYYDFTQGWIVRGQVRWKHGPLDVNFLYDAQDLQLPVFVTDYVVAPRTTLTIPLGFSNDRFNVPSNGINNTEQTVQRAMLTIDYDLGWAKATSTTLSTNSLSKQNYGSTIDLAQEAQFQSLGEVGVYPLGQASTRAKDNTIYEDFHLAGSFLNHRVSWLVGAEVLSQRDGNGLVTVTSPCPLTFTAGQPPGICSGRPGAVTCARLLPNSRNCPTPSALAFGSDTFTLQDYLSEAGYGSVKINLGYGFSIDGDLRYTSDDKNSTQTPYFLYTRTLNRGITDFDFSSNRTNYTVTLSYLIPGAWHDLLYAKTGTGYRAGGVNPGVSSPFAPIPFQTSYGDEDTTSYEGGVKGNITRLVYFTLAGYISRTSDAIASINDGCAVTNLCGQGPTVFNINAGDVHAHGVEAEVDTRFHLLGGRTSLSLTAANQHADYARVDGTYAGLPVLNSPVAQLPEWNASATFDYAHAITADVDGFLNVTWNGQWGGGQDTVTAITLYNPLDDFNDVSLRTGVNWRRLQLAFFIQNLTDETHVELQLQNPATPGVVTPGNVPGAPLVNRYNQPRTYGVNAVYRW